MTRTRRNWTAEEDNALRVAVNNALSHQRPLLWRELAKSVPSRSNKDCRRRWWNSLADGTTKGPWNEEEDRRLIKAVRENGTNWAQVAKSVASRNSDQCSSHWSQVLDPSINFADWTTEEDEALLHAVLTHGTNWSTIAHTHVPRRNSLALKNRYSTLRLKHRNREKSKQDGSARESCNTLGSPPDDSIKNFNSGKRSRTISYVSSGAAARGPYSSNDDERAGSDYDIDDDYDNDNDDDDDEEDDDDGDNQDRRMGDATFDAGSVGSAQFSNVTSTAGLSSRSEQGVSTPDTQDTFVDQGAVAFNLDSSIQYGGLASFTPTWPDEMLQPLPKSSTSHTMSFPDPTFGDDELFKAVYDSSTSGATSGTANPMQFKPIIGSLSDLTPTQNKQPATNTGVATAIGTAEPEMRDPMTDAFIPLISNGQHRVSIDFVCEAPKLQQVVVGLAGAGVSINMKIDAEA